jgi:hypothetical protein
MIHACAASTASWKCDSSDSLARMLPPKGVTGISSLQQIINMGSEESAEQDIACIQADQPEEETASGCAAAHHRSQHAKKHSRLAPTYQRQHIKPN